MQKKYTLITIASLLCYMLIHPVMAQTPEKMSYQAVVRDSDNNLVVNKTIGMQLSILQGSVSGTEVYKETQTPGTNENGLLTLEIGIGNVVSGVFTDIDWSKGPYFIKTETDPSGGTNYTITGVSQLLSVPYALHAKTAEKIIGGETDPLFNSSVAKNITSTDIDKWNTTNTNTQLTENQVDAFVNNNGYLTAEKDSSTTNEIQDLQLDGNNLTITNNGTATTIDLSPYLDNTNTQLTESQVDAFVNNNGYLTAEVDSSVTNEIQDLKLVGNNLTITNNGTATTIDLSPYLDDTNTQLTESQVDAFVNNNGYLTAEVDGSVTNELELPSQTGHAGKYLTTNGSSPSWVSGGGGSTVTTISSNTTLATGDQIVFINGAFTATFPASPTDGMKLVICSTNSSATINGNGKNFYISDLSFSSMTLADTGTNMYTFYYSSTLNAWMGNY